MAGDLVDPRDDARAIVPRVRLAMYRLGLVTTPAPDAPHYDGPALVTVRLRLVTGRVRDALQAAPELCHAMERRGVRVYQDPRGLIAVEVPKLQPLRLPLARMVPWQLGLSAVGQPAMVDLSKETNAVFCGATRSGKTTLMQVLAMHAARAGLRLAIADGKGRRWEPFSRSAALERAIARGPEEGDALLRWAADLVEARLQAGRRGPLLAVVADEAQTMDSGLLGRIAARCLEAGIRIVAGFQEPRRDQVDPLFARQCAARFAGVLADGGASTRLLGTPDATRLGPAADFLAVIDHAPAVRVAAAWVPQDDPAWQALDDGATPAVVTAGPAPAQARYQKADDSQALTWAWGEFQETGKAPSANAIMRRWGIHPRRAGRVREEVFRLSASQQGPAAGVGGQILAFPPGGKVA